MKIANVVKVAFMVVVTLYLAGCASTSDRTTGRNDQSSMSRTKRGVGVEVQPVMNPGVKAVMDSGEIDDSPENINALLQENTYFFPFDSSKLSDKAYKSLDVHAVYLNSEIGNLKKIVIQGHTDERGTRTYNLALGERRAKAVKDYLIAKGVSADRIEVISFGFERPMDPEHNSNAWALNRRALIIAQ